MESKFETIAKTLYGETRDCHVLDRLAIAAVIRERVLRPSNWGNDWITVCKGLPCWSRDSEELEAIDVGFAEDTGRFMAFMELTSYIQKHFTDNDLEPIFGTVLPVTHYHRKEESYPEGWDLGYREIPLQWRSHFVFYTDTDAPERGGSNEQDD